MEDEGWKNCADFFVGMNAATSLQTSRVCCGEKDFPPSPPSILHILFFIYLYRLLQLLYGVFYFYMSLRDRILRIFFLLHWSQQSFFHPSLKIKKAFLCIIVFYFVDTAVSSILCSRLLVIQTAFGSLLGDKQLIFMRNIWVFSKYCVCVVVPEKKSLLLLVFALVILQNCDTVTYLLSYLLSFVFLGLAERSSASQKSK